MIGDLHSQGAIKEVLPRATGEKVPTKKIGISSRIYIPPIKINTRGPNESCGSFFYLKNSSAFAQEVLRRPAYRQAGISLRKKL
jgi:hypothetical protein